MVHICLCAPSHFTENWWINFSKLIVLSAEPKGLKRIFTGFLVWLLSIQKGIKAIRLQPYPHVLTSPSLSALIYISIHYSGQERERGSMSEEILTRMIMSIMTAAPQPPAIAAIWAVLKPSSPVGVGGVVVFALDFITTDVWEALMLVLVSDWWELRLVVGATLSVTMAECAPVIEVALIVRPENDMR